MQPSEEPQSVQPSVVPQSEECSEEQQRVECMNNIYYIYDSRKQCLRGTRSPWPEVISSYTRFS